jgi:phage gp16-like protein
MNNDDLLRFDKLVKDVNRLDIAKRKIADKVVEENEIDKLRSRSVLKRKSFKSSFFNKN